MKYLILFIIMFVPLFSAQNLEKITLQLQWYHQFQFAGYYMAKEKGFYAQEGLDVEIKEYQSNLNPVEQVISKKADYATGRSSLVIDASKGEDVVVLSAIFQASPLVLATRLDSGINCIEDLNGKRMGGDHTVINTVAINAMLEKYHIAVDYIHGDGMKSDIANLLLDNVDVIAVYMANELYALRQMNIKYKMFNPIKYNLNFYSDILFTSGDEVRGNRQRASAFKRASLKGWEYAFSHIEETVQLILDKYNTQNKTREALTFEAYKLIELAYYKTDKIGKIDRDKIKNIYTLYKKFGWIENKIDLDTFIFHDDETSIVKFTKEEIAYLKQKKEIIVCGLEEWDPYINLKGEKPIGILPELMHEYSKIIGIPINYRNMINQNNCLEKIKNKEVDIVDVILKDFNTQKYLTPTKTYSSDFLVLVTRSEKPYIKNGADIKNLNVAIVGAFKNMVTYVQKQYPHLHLVYVEDLKEGLKKVARGKVDAYVGVFMPIAFAINKHYAKELKINDRFGELELNGGMGVRKDEPLLVSILNKAIDTLDPHKKREIMNAWISVTQEKKFDYSLLWKLLFILLVVILLIMYHQFILKKENIKLKKAKDKLKESERALQTLNENLENEIALAVADLNKSQEQAKLGSWKHDIVLDKLSWSDETYHIFELDKTVNMTSYKNFLTAIHPDDKEKIRTAYANSLKTQKPYEITHRLVMADGRIKWVKERCDISFDSEGNALVSYGTIQDITSETIAEKKLREKESIMFKQAQLAQMGEMLSMIAHQWRQPLAAISATTNVLILKIERDVYEYDFFEDKLSKIVNYSQHLSRTIDDFRNFFKTHKDKENTTIKAVIDDVLQLTRIVLESKNIQIITDLKYNKKVKIYANELKQVMLNLIKNSEDILLETKVPSPQIILRTFEENNSIVITIEDNGGGIKTAIIDKIFDPYFSTKLDKEGTGLGLYMSKIIVHEHCSGILTVTNGSRGAIFRIEMRNKEEL